MRVPPPAGGTCGVPAGGTCGVYRGADLIFFLPVHHCFAMPVFCISSSLSFAFASVHARVILNNRYPARGVYRGGGGTLYDIIQSCISNFV